ncbi:hypothetical protein GHT06_021083 [Daphnia sinensis]|uniref:Glucose-methanol-choline oxidoreductase C-terminal domain-containing protein n=1 Tax=Daphnia sinensis TaxID=1820382 RepID=A0AAD5KIQ3_9CRUS|nr:hypothetical protein GHT06_021083 [Daphnia sinensis]
MRQPMTMTGQTLHSRPFLGQRRRTVGQFFAIILISPWLLRSLSRGTVWLASSDPYAAPLMDPKYYSDPNDLDTMLEALKFSLALRWDHQQILLPLLILS